MNNQGPHFHDGSEENTLLFPTAHPSGMIDVFWDEDKENLPPEAIWASETNDPRPRRPPRHIRDPGSPELGTGNMGFSSRFDELRLQNEGVLVDLREPHGLPTPYYQSYERPFLNAQGEDPFPRATRRGEAPRDDDWEIWEDEQDRERHYYGYSGESGNDDEEEGADDVAPLSSSPRALSSLEDQSSPRQTTELRDASPDLGHQVVSAEGRHEGPPQEEHRMGDRPSWARPIARMRHRRGSRTLREQARMEALQRHEMDLTQ